MSDLTLEKMDKINFLLTEVSLELLGNKFYDIYGDQTDTIVYLLSTNSMKPKPHHSEHNSGLLNALQCRTVEGDGENGIPRSEQTATKQRKRRASFSGKEAETLSNEAKENDNESESESLLIPLVTAKPAKIARRRFTTTTNSSSTTSNAERIKATNDYDKIRRLEIERQKMLLKKDTDKEFIRMQFASDVDQQAFRIKNPTATTKDFYEYQQMKLKKKIYTLLEFIKLIRNDPDNENKLTNTSSCILELKADLD